MAMRDRVCVGGGGGWRRRERGEWRGGGRSQEVIMFLCFISMEKNKADGGQIVGDVPVFDAITSDHCGRLP